MSNDNGLVTVSLSSISIEEHKERHRGPTSWMEPTGSFVSANRGNDYDIAMALLSGARLWVDGKRAEGEVLEEARKEILRHVAENRRHFSGPVKKWASHVWWMVQKANLVSPWRSFTFTSYEKFYAPDGDFTYGLPSIATCDEESPLHLVNRFGPQKSKDRTVWVWDLERKEKFLFRCEESDGSLVWKESDRLEWTTPPQRFHIHFEEQKEAPGYAGMGQDVIATSIDDAAIAALLIKGRIRDEAWEFMNGLGVATLQMADGRHDYLKVGDAWSRVSLRADVPQFSSMDYLPPRPVAGAGPTTDLFY